MNRILTGLFVSVSVLALAACGEDKPAFNISTYTGSVYAGTASGTATPPGETPESQGPFSSAFRLSTQSGNRAEIIIVESDPNQGASLRWTLQGTHDENGGSFDLAEVCFLIEDPDPICGPPEETALNLTIKADGTIEGTADMETVFGPADFSISGQITSSSLDLGYDGEITEDTSGYPVGTEVRLVYDLSR